MKHRNWVWGLFFVAVAALIIGTAFGYVPGISVWRVILTVLLGAMAVQSLFYLEFFGVFVPLAVIGILFDTQLGIEALTPWPILAAAVCLSIGFHILFRGAVRRRRDSYRERHGYSYHTHPGTHNGTHSGTEEEGAERPQYGGHSGHDYKESRETIHDDSVACEVTFGAGIKYLHSQSLRHANFTCSFGSLKVYFDQAKLSGEGAYVNVECSFANMELYIPRGWKVVDKVTPTLGRIKNNHNAPEGEAAALTLTGSVQFGNVEIIYI